MPMPQGPYSSAIRVGETVYISGQLPLTASDTIPSAPVDQVHQVFRNLKALIHENFSDVQNGASVVKLTVFLTDIRYSVAVDEAIREHLSSPFPARTLVEVSRLPREAAITVDAILHLGYY